MVLKTQSNMNDAVRRREQLLGKVLIVGVLLSALLILCGGVAYLAQNGGLHPNYAVFHGEQAALTSLWSTLILALHGNSKAIIQLGLFVLVLLQSVRVGLCVWLFGLQKEWPYVVMSLFLLAILLHSFV